MGTFTVTGTATAADELLSVSRSAADPAPNYVPAIATHNIDAATKGIFMIYDLPDRQT